jgi:hypothetical protein
VTGAAGSVSEQQHGPSRTGSVVLDIGGNIGALIIHTLEDLAGQELDIEGLGDGTVSTHSLVRERQLPQGATYAAVYPGLPAGAYLVQGAPGRPAEKIQIHGGRITEIDWRTAGATEPGSRHQPEHAFSGSTS